jgi:PAS domain-containing protein
MLGAELGSRHLRAVHCRINCSSRSQSDLQGFQHKALTFASEGTTMMAGCAASLWPSGGSEMASRVRDFEWAKTPLGSIEAWPQSLKTVVDLALSAPQPMFVAAGADLICIYNDGYLPILGERHPAMLGMPFAVAFAEIWEQLDLLVADTLKGNSHLVMDQSFALPWRPDQPQSWFTYSYTPFQNEEGFVAGFLVVVIETTDRLLAERKLREDEKHQAFLLKLSDTLRPIADPLAVQREASRILREHLGAGRVAYYETSDDEEMVSTLTEDVADGFPSLLGRHFRWADFEPRGFGQVSAGAQCRAGGCPGGGQHQPRTGGCFCGDLHTGLHAHAPDEVRSTGRLSLGRFQRAASFNTCRDQALGRNRRTDLGSC